MKAIICRGFGTADSLALGDIEAPAPKRGQVLVDVHSAAVTFMDVLMAAGNYQMRPPLPFVPGTDASGVVAAVGEGVTRLKVGDRVACGSWFGAWGQQMVTDEHGAIPLPAEVDFAVGAAVRHGYGTAHYALVERAQLRAGETVFVSGAAGGVGLAAVDLARHLGARVIAGVGSSDKEACVRGRGAAEVINYSQENLKDRIKALTGGAGVDVFFDNVGGEVFATMSRLMNWDGRILPIGFTSGEIPTMPLNLPLLKNYSVVGAFWGAWTQRYPKESAAADERLLKLVAAGELRPLVAQRLPMEEFADAIESVRQRRVQGRIVLEIAQA